MAMDVTYTDVEDIDGKPGDVTYRLPTGTDITDLDEADVADFAISTTWNYKDGTKKVFNA